MAGIRFSGMASGLPPNIVEQIMDAERIPLKTMEVSKAKEDDKLKLVTDLETKVSDITKNFGELVSNRGFSNMKMTSGDPAIIDGTVDPNTAASGQWSVEVMQLAQKPGAISNGFPDKDKTQMGVGYLRFNTTEGKKDVYINAKNSTLDGVANTINASGLGMRATVLNDRSDQDNPYRIMISGLSTGKDNQMEFPTVYMLDGDQDMYFEEAKKAQNAKIKLDGFEVELPDNVTGDLIPGVNLDLKQAAIGKEVRINVKEDVEKIAEKVKTFVDNFNAALSFIQGQAKLQKSADGKERLGPLGGDGMVRSIESGLRRLIMNPQLGVASPIKRLNELGIEFARNGTLNFNQEKFNNTLNKDPQAVADFFRGDGFKTGFIPTVKREIGNLLNSAFGPIANRKRGIQSKIDSVNKRIDNKQRQLEKREDTLRRQFSDLESKMSKLQAQGSAVGGIGGAMQQPQG